MHLAAYGGNSEVVTFLLNRNNNIHITCSRGQYEGYSPLYLAAFKEYLDTVKLLRGHLTVINYLTQKEVSIHGVGIVKGYSPVSTAAKYSQLATVCLLLDKGAHINATYIAPLHLAAKKSYMHMVKFLVENSATVNAKDSSGKTPLHYAIIKSYIAIGSYLLQNGAYINAEDMYCYTPLHLTVKKDCIGG